ncbi:MAG: hypothetical protein ACLSF2_08455 [Butyricicoccus sp.]
MTLDAVNRACELVEQLGAGEVIDGIIDVDNSDPNHKRLPFEPDKMNALLGLELSAEEQVKLLEKLDFQIENNEVVVPFFRTDINRMCDVAEVAACTATTRSRPRCTQARWYRVSSRRPSRRSALPLWFAARQALTSP